jgi:PAS domain S-box-containing protein
MPTKPRANRSAAPRRAAPADACLPLFRQLEILDDRSEQAFDRILTLAADLFDASHCGILVREGKRYWHKMRGGKILTDMMPSDGSFVRYTMAGEDTFFVADAAADPRFRDHPRVAGGPRIRSYIGAPLVDQDGRRIGALAVMDEKPRPAPTSLQRRLLRHLASDIMTQIQSRTHQYISERLHVSEARLHRSEAHMARAQHLADVGSAEIDWVGDDHYWSDQTYRIFGLPPGSRIPSPEELMGDIVHPDDRALVRDYYERQKHGEHSQQCEYRIVRPDGEVRTIVRFGEVITDHEGRPVRNMMAFQDVTELRAAERERDEYQRQLHHAQRLDALGTLAGGIAHDLNNTLVPVLALTKLMRTTVVSEDDRRSNLEVIQRAGERARDLVRQVLAFSRKTPVERHRVDLSAVVGESLGMLRAGVDPRIRIDENLMPTAAAMADPGQIHQLVINLVTNAVQAIGEQPGTVSISLDPLDADHSRVRLTVSDDGEGMDDRTMARMFEPFFTTRDVGTGTGLGLSIVHGIVTGHGGRIAVNSTPGHGTSFAIDLPTYMPTAAAELAVAAV